jgi:outer membrane protein assembly factor BamA
VFSHAGIANHEALSNRILRAERYEGRRLTVSANVRGEFQIADWTQASGTGEHRTVLRAFGGWNLAYDRFRAESGSQLLLDAPAALDDGQFRGTYYGGLVFDDRDNDWNPQRGGLFDVSGAAGGPWAGGASQWGRLNLSLRRYVNLRERLVWASEVLVEGQLGEVPLIPLGEFSGVAFRGGVGGVDTGRGYFRRRFVGGEKAYASSELRWEPTRVHLWKIPVDIGLKPFVDLGMVGDRARNLAPGVHASAGAGVYVVWDEFEVVRADLGVSPEGVVVVMAADHAF